MHDPLVLAFKRKITLLGDPSVERQRALVAISTPDRRSFSHRAAAVRGTPDNPMSMQDITHKAFGLMAPVLGETDTHELIDTLWSIDKVDDVRDFRRLLGSARR